uniref:Zinc finger protein 217 n=1 Tax=Leptobrachium leishanense TaxID=445787 RepID=A0A8C5R038_9ANUR
MPEQSSELIAAAIRLGSTCESEINRSRSTNILVLESTEAENPPQKSSPQMAALCVCTCCNKTFTSNEELTLHLGVHQLPDTPVLSPDNGSSSSENECPKSVDSKDECCEILQSKATNEDDGKLVECEICLHTCSTSQDLENHMSKHRFAYPYHCVTCGRRYKKSWFLRNHMEKHNGKLKSRKRKRRSRDHTDQPIEELATINDVVLEPPEKIKTDMIKKCIGCGHLFNKNKIRQHYAKHLQESTNEPDKNAVFPTPPADGSNERILKANNNSVSEKVEEVPKETFMGFLGLMPVSTKVENRNLWVAELNPIVSFLAWEIDTKVKANDGDEKSKANSLKISPNIENVSDKEPKVKRRRTGSQLLTCNNEKVTRKLLTPVQPLEIVPNEVPNKEKNPANKKRKPTVCDYCGKFFNTYHQLVLHLRVHIKGRNDSECSSVSSNVSSESMASMEVQELQQLDNKIEEGSADGTGDSVQIEKSEARTRRKQKSSAKCIHCGKSFDSLYYLNVHIRSHTGEKPYECEVCSYKCAQATSLRYHLKNHHAFKDADASASVKMMSKKVSQKYLNASKNQTGPSAMEVTNHKEDSMPAIKSETLSFEENGSEKANTPVEKMDTLRTSSIVNGHVKTMFPSTSVLDKGVPTGLGTRKSSCDKQNTESGAAVDHQIMPLNLSLKNKGVTCNPPAKICFMPSIPCPFCGHKASCLEVLDIHIKIEHRSSPALKNAFNYISSEQPFKRRRTGCPPALNGMDVSPLDLNGSKAKIPLIHLKPDCNENVKGAPLFPNSDIPSGTDLRNCEEQNLVLYPRQNHPINDCTFMQHDLQQISHLVERMQYPEPNRATWNGSRSFKKENHEFSPDRHVHKELHSMHNLKKTMQNISNHLANVAVARESLHSGNGDRPHREMTPVTPATIASGLNAPEVDIQHVMVIPPEMPVLAPAHGVSDPGPSSTTEGRRRSARRQSKADSMLKDKRL